MVEDGQVYLGNSNEGKQSFSLRIYVNIARCWALISIYSCRCQRLQLLSCTCLHLYSQRWASLSAPSQKESVDFSPFCWNPLLLYWSPVSVMVRCGGGRTFYNLMIKSQSFCGPVSQGYDLHTFLQWYSPLPLVAAVEAVPFPQLE